MDHLQRNLADHFAAGGTLEQAANKHKNWEEPKGKESLSMWQVEKSIEEIEADMKRRTREYHASVIKQSLRQQQSQKSS